MATWWQLNANSTRVARPPQTQLLSLKGTAVPTVGTTVTRLQPVGSTTVDVGGAEGLSKDTPQLLNTIGSRMHSALELEPSPSTAGSTGKCIHMQHFCALVPIAAC